MSKVGVFLKPIEWYKRNIHPIKNYVDLMSFYYSKMKNCSYEEAKQHIIEVVKKNYKGKSTIYFERKENLDKYIQKDSLLNYINSIITSNKILVPSFTSYLSKEEKVSLISKYTENNVIKRAKSKKLAQEAKMRKDEVTYINKNNEQNNMKIYNNSLSGSFTQETCMLYNKTAHSTLTTITRTTSSLANASNERFIAGNRYYDSAITVLNNCIFLARYTNEELVEQVLTKYNLHRPSVEDCVNVLKYSSNLYWRDDSSYENKIIPFLKTLSDAQRASICYSGDFYHLRQYNPEFILSFLEDISYRVEATEIIPDIANKLYELDENLLNYTTQLFYYEFKGLGKKYEEIKDKKLLSSLYLTSVRVVERLKHYQDFIDAFLINECIPNNNNKIKLMRRRAVVLSDTDSTCFSVDNWVKWYNNGEVKFDQKSISIAASVAYLCTQLIPHWLAMFSANMNVAKEDLFLISMKNEFLWFLHAPAQVSKHYCALTVMQEGNIFHEPELEIKGVHFINSAINPEIISNFKDFAKNNFLEFIEKGYLNATDIIRKCIELENSIKDSILLRRETSYFKKSRILEKEAYALDEDKSPYQRHKFWNMIFSHKYGTLAEPPYDVIKIPTKIKTKTDFINWVNNIQDEQIKNKLMQYAKETGKYKLETFYINADFAKANSIPEEIRSIIDIEKIILELTYPYRLYLEVLGFLLDKDKLIMDHFKI
jgi:hypothetical protein